MKNLEKLILELGELARRSHYYCDEDSWYSCPKAPEGCANDAVGDECNCGVDEHNAKVDSVVKRAIATNKWSKILDPSKYSHITTKAILLEPQEHWIPK